jgi:hypothetical protein
MYEIVIHLDQLSESLGIAATCLPYEFGFQVNASPAPFLRIRRLPLTKPWGHQ